ncbi:MAG: ATP-binding protein [Thermaerobacter sp.]|nr:ATP-binding protein [Thermaerobacter sp.]
MNGTRREFPFVAVVGQEDLKLALRLNAISAAVGGVLAEGERGNAKTTTARAFAELLAPVPVRAGCRHGCDPEQPYPYCRSCAEDPGEIVWRPAPMVELPLGAAEDRVSGHLRLETVLAEGRREFQPGLLAEAHRGVLYVDEVNLLEDHLVDVLLDAAASGWARVERDGFSFQYPSRFVLVGSMNPEEGELRPQLLDRFGLMVRVATPLDPTVRAEIVTRRLAFHRDPDGFLLGWAEQEERERRRLAEARERLAEVELSADLLAYIVELTLRAGAEGLRADIVMAEAARAYAAWQGAAAVTYDHVLAVAPMVLAHRAKKSYDPPPPPSPGPAGDRGTTPGQSGDTDLNLKPGLEVESSGPEDRVTAVDTGIPPICLRTGNAAHPAALPRTDRGQRGRAAAAAIRRGRTVGTVPWEKSPAPRPLRWPIDWPATLARTPRRLLPIALDAVMVSRRVLPQRPLRVFLLDASASMAGHRRMSRTKGLVLAMAREGYRKRAHTAVLAFRRDQGSVVLSPTGKTDLVARALEALPAGGNTPLWEGLELAGRAIRRWTRQAGYRPHLLIVTDGRVRLTAEVAAATADWGRRMRLSGTAITVVDAEWGLVRVAGARRLADILGADWISHDA